jgi:hypothetical protein
MCVPNIRALSFTKQTLLDLKGKIGSSTIITGDFKHSTFINGQIIQKDGKETSEWKYSVDQIHLTFTEHSRILHQGIKLCLE